jgi:hypothetical protein
VEVRDMNGTEKQIKWAEDIKKNVLSYLDQTEAQANESYWTAESFGYTLKDVKAVRADIEKFFGTVKDAKQIIDRRDYLTARRLESLCVMHHNTTV